jgi:hypothetical protein
MSRTMKWTGDLTHVFQHSLSTSRFAVTRHVLPFLSLMSRKSKKNILYFKIEISVVDTTSLNIVVTEHNSNIFIQ